jgi:phospholipid-binding lipoprotein MlaA
MPQRRPVVIGSAIGLAAALLLVGGCATTAGQERGSPGQKLDPWEGWNRKVFNFNEELDVHLLKPVATAYSKVVPQPVRQGVDNFFDNAQDAWSAVNNFLQGKIEYGFETAMRFGVNTVFGVAGVVDVSTDLGLVRHKEDFGQTLGRWGFGAGAYIVWPLFGPSSVRDSIALPLDRAASPALVIKNGGYQFAITTLQIVNTRADLLGASQVLDDIALDKYTFVRDAYLQRRRSLVYDGDEPAGSSSDKDDGYAPMETTPAPAPNGAAPKPAAKPASAPGK